MKLIGIYAYIDGRAADVFRFYADGTYLFSLLKHGADEPRFTLGGLVAVGSWLARETYPGATKHAGQVVGTFTLERSTVTLTRIPWYAREPIEYRGEVRHGAIDFETLDRNRGEHARQTFHAVG
ncbi:MAG: hypothetical protein ACRDKI_09710 [Solirubrobacterales bacterium]